VGLALPNLGDIDAQTIAGAISTGTHGTGARFQSIAAAVVSLRLVAGDGSIVIASPEENPALFEVARVGLGALGVISEVTLECVPAFSLHAVEEPRRLDDVLAHFDDWADTSDHAEFFWFPHTDTAATKTNTRVELCPDTRARWKRVLDEEVVQNALFGTVTHLGAMRSSLIPGLARTVANRLGRTEYNAPSHAVFTSPRRVRFKEMEYNLPRAALLEAFARVRGLIDDLHHPVSFPIEVRVLGSDDIPLSPAFERRSAYIAVHVPAREPHEEYFDGVEAIMNDYGGRPHWGKLHSQTASTLRFRYPQWSAFRTQRDIIDPHRCFTNPELARVLGD
jgi:L-gulonolactone oxidase